VQPASLLSISAHVPREGSKGEVAMEGMREEVKTHLVVAASMN
jgi:hypothetical protein